MKLRNAVLALGLLLMGITCAHAQSNHTTEWKPGNVVFTSGVVQGQVIARPSHFFAWDYDTTGLTEQAIVRFELRLDGGGILDAGMTQNGATPTLTTFQFPVPAMVPGPHVAEVRACNAVECGDWSDPLNFVFSIRPGKPLNLRPLIIPQ